jgi:CBS-domain-containing membrane protein
MERARSSYRANLWGYLCKMKGGVTTAPTASVKDAIISGIGGLLGIGIVSYLSVLSGFPWLMAPFGASCVLAFSIHKGPLSQPRAIIGGHIVSTTAGLLVLNLFGETWWSIALAVCLAIIGMMLTKTVHPPAGADPIVVIMAKASWLFLLHPVLIGAVALVIVALVYNNLFKERQYPQYWW